MRSMCEKGQMRSICIKDKYMLFRDALAAQTATVQWLAIHDVHTGVSRRIQQWRMQDMVPLQAPKNEKGLPHGVQVVTHIVAPYALHGLSKLSK